MNAALPSSDAQFWTWSETDALKALNSTPFGLTRAEAAARLRHSGAVAPHHRRNALVVLLRQFANPITLILVFATLVSAALGEATDATIILAIILLSGVLSFWQEYAASRAVEDLMARVEVTVEVLRDGEHTFLPSHEIVPGDVVVLDTGDLVPGDCLVLDGHELLADEAPLTGESYPVDKSPGVVAAEMQLAGRTNCLFEGTHIVRGGAVALVVLTGANTAFGRVAAELEARPPVTRFERGLTDFGRLLVALMVIMTVLIFIANVLLARPIIDSLLFSVALAVGLTPQLLPAIVSVSLSMGARQMARAKVITKRLNAIEDFGGMDVLCTDKTGTLTTGTVQFNQALDIDGRSSVDVLEEATLNARLHTSFANPIDDAIIRGAGHAVTAQMLAELPYDFQRRRLSVLVACEGEQDHRLLTKGAVDDVVAVCSNARRRDGTIAPLDQLRTAINDRFERLSNDGYRVLGVASRSLGATTALAPADESGMVFDGFLTFQDPPKPDAARALRELAALGISLRMVTGDNHLAALHVARAVGMDTAKTLTGADLRALNDTALASAAIDATVFAEVDPIQKERLIRALRQSGHDVGFLGDGINDAPALYAADVGISVDSAVDVAKDAASVVLLEKDLDVLMEGVRLGRRTFANTLKYLFVTISANFGNMFSMAAASLLLPFLPLLPMQILLLNFLTDLPATTIATDDVDREQLERPGAWDLGMLRSFMIVFGLVSSVFDVLTFLMLLLGFRADETLFRTGWFLESAWTELAVMLVLRTRRPFFRSRPSAMLLATSLIVGLVTLVIPYSPASQLLGFEPLPFVIVVAVALMIASYVLATEIVKRFFYRAPNRGAGSSIRASA
jgi:P-type Mg2+ transporter